MMHGPDAHGLAAERSSAPTGMPIEMRMEEAMARRQLLRRLLGRALVVACGLAGSPGGQAAQGQAGADADNPPLVLAAARGDDAAVERLLGAGADVNARDRRGRNAVLAATQGGHESVARRLIARGADINAQDHLQDSAFLLAGARGHTGIVRAALDAKVPPDLRLTNRYGGTALIPACHYGHVETVRVLLATAIDVNHINRLGWTALLEAIILGDGGSAHTEIVRLLLTHGAKPGLADGQGVSPLAHARQRGQRQIEALLLAAGAR
jgi:ankyrin repeat protein